MFDQPFLALLRRCFRGRQRAVTYAIRVHFAAFGAAFGGHICHSRAIYSSRSTCSSYRATSILGHPRENFSFESPRSHTARSISRVILHLAIWRPCPSAAGAGCGVRDRSIIHLLILRRACARLGLCLGLRPHFAKFF
jgi:hypothetical protein